MENLDLLISYFGDYVGIVENRKGCWRARRGATDLGWSGTIEGAIELVWDNHRKRMAEECESARYKGED